MDLNNWYTNLYIKYKLVCQILSSTRFWQRGPQVGGKMDRRTTRGLFSSFQVRNPKNVKLDCNILVILWRRYIFVISAHYYLLHFFRTAYQWRCNRVRSIKLTLIIVDFFTFIPTEFYNVILNKPGLIKYIQSSY